MPPTGTGTATREAIRTAAARLFRDQGFARTTVRRIAADAGADPALVIRHFKSKELLFLETMHLTVDEAPLLDVAVEQLGERLAELLLDLDGSARGIFLALVHGSDEPQILDRLRRTHERVLIEPLRNRLPGPDADLRARLAASTAAGLLYALWVAGDEGLLRADRKELIRHYGALLQEALTPHAREAAGPVRRADAKSGTDGSVTSPTPAPQPMGAG
ncbi:TetR family transcriptional regulator [Streptomyces bungoensis]|uniref:TetR/AcrR family transcriptional regulator n=1 Tax=Streptomyces bungoensis TaxID=285568 RepID=UPI00099EC8A4|nr:TetR family transcriptional regulator [Streptomyces bungoensis]